MARHEYVPLSTAGTAGERDGVARTGSMLTGRDEGPAYAPRRRAFLLAMAGSVLVSLSAGSNYAFSAWAPQLQANLALSAVQTNLVGLAGNAGVYVSAPLWGPYLDRTGPSRTLYACSVLVLVGYGGLAMVDHIAQAAGPLLLLLLLLLHCLTGVANAGAFGAGMNALARSASAEVQGTALGIALAGYALSASAYSAMANLLRLTTPQYLALVALGSATSFAIGGAGGVRIVPLAPEQQAFDEAHSISRASQEGLVGDDRAPEARVEMTEYARHGPLPSPRRLGAANEAEHLPVSPVPASDAFAEHSSWDDDVRPPRQIDPAPEHTEPLLRPAGVPDGRLDRSRSLSGWAVVRTPDFSLLFTVMVCVAGSGLLLINNVGTITQTLWQYGPQHVPRAVGEADREAVRLWQARQVIAISLGNAFGRLATGFLADLVVHISGQKASKFLLLVLPVSTFCLATQVVLAGLAPRSLHVQTVHALLLLSALNGVTYGTLFGLCPSLTIDLWGLSKFSSNWGIMALSPAVGGNAFNLYFGWVYDQHADPAPPAPPAGQRRAGPSRASECSAGEACYQDAFRATTLAAVISLILSICLAVRQNRLARR